MPLTGLVLRLTKGSPLSAVEGDRNFSIIRDFCNALEQLFGVVLKPNGTLKDSTVGTSAIVDGSVTGAKLAADAKLQPGMMMPFGGTSPPSGWLECNGAAVSRTTYAALFAAIGTAHGVGDGSTTFNLPDMRRRTAVGAGGSGTATLGNAVGNTGGGETHTLTLAQLPASVSIPQRLTPSGDPYLMHDNENNSDIGVNSDSGTDVKGSGQAFNIMQPSLVALWVIKT